jgi:ribose 5-phosphate isomerase A
MLRQLAARVPGGARVTAEVQKRIVADQAADLVQDGMLVGLGTGTTAALAIEALIRRARDGLIITCVPTSTRSEAQALAGGLRVLHEPPADRMIDLTIDGADEVEDGTLNLIKGLGGALLREKIVAASTKRLVIIADAGKRVTRLGEKAPVPIEVVRFGWETTERRLRALGARSEPRRAADGSLYVTDGKNYILDCHFPADAPLAGLEREIAAIVGVVETGLFIGMADTALIGTAVGVETMRRGGN